MATHFFSLSLVLAIVQMLLAWGVMVWLWGVFLDKYEHDPGRVRSAMCVLLIAATAAEAGLSAVGLMSGWVAVVVVLANVWGGLDALLRYPAAHRLESFFVMKQFSLLGLKTMACAVGVSAMRRHVALMIALLPGLTWGLPLLYLMALPMDPSEQVARDDACDVDLALRVWQLAVCSSERRACVATCRGWWYRRLSAASESSSLARLAVCAASPEHRRVFRRMGRGRGV